MVRKRGLGGHEDEHARVCSLSFSKHRCGTATCTGKRRCLTWPMPDMFE